MNIKKVNDNEIIMNKLWLSSDFPSHPTNIKLSLKNYQNKQTKAQ